MEKIKPEIALKQSMNGKKMCVCVCVHIIQRISESNGKSLLTRKKKKLENTTNVALFSEHKNFFLKVLFISSCIFIK